MPVYMRDDGVREEPVRALRLRAEDRNHRRSVELRVRERTDNGGEVRAVTLERGDGFTAIRLGVPLRGNVVAAVNDRPIRERLRDRLAIRDRLHEPRVRDICP